MPVNLIHYQFVTSGSFKKISQISLCSTVGSIHPFPGDARQGVTSGSAGQPTIWNRIITPILLWRKWFSKEHKAHWLARWLFLLLFKRLNRLVNQCGSYYKKPETTKVLIDGSMSATGFFFSSKIIITVRISEKDICDIWFFFPRE